MRKKLGEVKIEGLRYSFFSAGNGFQVVCTGPLTLKVRGVILRPLLEEAVLSLFLKLNDPIVTLKNDLLVYEYTKFDNFILSNFQALDPVEVRKTLKELGWIVSPPSQKNGISPFPAEYLEKHSGNSFRSSCVAALKVKKEAKNLFNKVKDQLYSFDFQNFSIDALNAMVAILSGRPLDSEKREKIASQEYVMRGPFVNDDSAIFIQFQDNKVINIEPDYVSLIVPKTNHVLVRKEYTDIFLDLLRKVEPSTILYGKSFDGIFFGVLSSGELVVIPEEKVVNDPKIRIIWAKDLDKTMTEQIKRLFGLQHIDDEFSPGLYEFFLHGGKKSDVKLGHLSLQEV